MPDNIEDWLGKEARSTKRTSTLRIDRVAEDIVDGILRVEGSETVIEGEGIVTRVICQSTRGHCGHIVAPENVVRCSGNHEVCRECVVACSRCGRLLCPSEKREFLDEKIFCSLCFNAEKARKAFPFLF
jgi:hypothetical protein